MDVGLSVKPGTAGTECRFLIDSGSRRGRHSPRERRCRARCAAPGRLIKSAGARAPGGKPPGRGGGILLAVARGGFDLGIDRASRRSSLGRDAVVLVASGSIRLLLLAVEPGERPSCQLHVRPHGQGRLVLPSRQVELTGGRQQVSEVGVPGGIAARQAQERKGFIGLPGGRQGQAQVDSDPLVVGCELGGRSQSFLGIRPSALEIIAVAGVVPDLRVFRREP